jgi:hypothetical protein
MQGIDYKKKALKYKVKYLELKKQLMKMNLGGKPEWYDQFETELKNIFKLVKDKENYKKFDIVTYDIKYPILTGSAAIAFVLNYLHMDDELDKLDENGVKPNDLDFLYFSGLDITNPDTIGEFRIKPEQKFEKSVTFELRPHDPSRQIQKFDISNTAPTTKSFVIDGVEIVNMETLKRIYENNTDDSRRVTDNYKIQLIEKIIKEIKKDERRLKEFGINEDVTKIRGDGKKLSFFRGYDDDLGTELNKKPYSLFGDDLGTESNKKYKQSFSLLDDLDFSSESENHNSVQMNISEHEAKTKSTFDSPIKPMTNFIYGTP